MLLSPDSDILSESGFLSFSVIFLYYKNSCNHRLLDSAKHLPAKYVLFDSWFAFPKTICNICKRKYDVICGSFQSFEFPHF